MLLDAFLAWFHFLAIFVLVVVLTAEAVLLRPDLTPATLKRLVIYDRLYLLSAILVLATGVLRLMLGIKGAAFYMGNPGSTPRSRCSSSSASVRSRPHWPSCAGPNRRASSPPSCPTPRRSSAPAAG